MAGRFRVGEWTVLQELNSLERNGRTVHLEPKVMQVLVTLSEHPGEVVSKEQIFHRVWPGTFVSDEVLTRSVSELRKVFEDNPQDPKYIQTIPKGGYRLVAAVVLEGSKPANWLAGHRKKLAGAAAILLLIVAASLYILKGRQQASSRTGITSLAVLPLTNLSGDPGQDYFADGMTDELTTRLSNISALRVISRTSVMHYKSTQKTIPEIARELNVDAVLEGSVLRSGDRVRISTQLIHGHTDKHLWAESYERDLHDILALQAEVARTIAYEIKIQVTPQERTKLVSAAAVNPQVHDSYLKGRYYWNKFTEEGVRKAVVYFEQAIQEDPGFAPAYAGLASAYHELAFYVAPKEVMPKAKEAAMRALSLDDSDAEAHAALGWIKWHYDWDWSGAEQEYTRAIESNPSDSNAHAQYAIYLDEMGRFKEGFREHYIALGLDPLSLIDRTSLGDAFGGVGQYEEAVEQYQKALDLDADFVLAHAGIGMAYAQQGKFQQAVLHLQKAMQLDPDPDFTAGMAYVQAASGNRNEARKLLVQLLNLSPKRYVASVDIAVAYLAVGEQDHSCEWLERAYHEHDSYLPGIKFDPAFTKLGSNPCFRSVMRRMGLPQ